MIEQTLTVVSVKGTTANLEAEQKQACAGAMAVVAHKSLPSYLVPLKTLYTFDNELKVGQKNLSVG